MDARYVQSGDSIDFRPDRDVAAGELVLVGRLVGVAKLDVRAGEQCGIIKFGSRIDFYLPLDAEIVVKIGERVRACESVIAKLR